MKPRITVSESAAAELYATVEWYEAKRDGLGIDFRDSIDETIENIRQYADRGTPLLAIVSRTVRRHLVPKFPYQVIYYVDGTDLVVIAIAHTSRRPHYWQTRLHAKVT